MTTPGTSIPATTVPGIIFGMELATGAPVTDLDAPASWLHLNRADDHVKGWVSQRAGIPKRAAEALLTEETRPRVEIFRGGVLINLRAANLNKDVDEETIALRMWLEPTRLITLERYPIFAARDIHKKTQQPGVPRAPGALVARLAERLIERLEPVIDALDEALYDLEDRAIDPDRCVERRELATLQRKVIHLRRYLAPQREALFKLTRGDAYPFEPADLERLKEAANHLVRLVEDLDAAHERATVAQGEQAAQVSEAQNKRLYVFTIVTIIFLPLSFLTGVFGMNVGGLPWVETPMGFAIVAAMMLALAGVTVGLMIWKKWV